VFVNKDVAFIDYATLASEGLSAHMWFNLAAVSGDEDAVKNRDLVAENMTPADIAAAQQMASDWVKAHP
jgi:uncharacterized protein